MSKLTPRQLATMKAGEWASDGGARGGGALYARCLMGGQVLFYFRYTNTQGGREAHPLGQWSGEKKGLGMSLVQARYAAVDLSRRYRNGERDLIQIIDAETREEARKREAASRAAEAEATEKRATLGALLSAYVEQLKQGGKQSKRSVELALERHVRKAWPVLWDTPAAQVTTDDLLSVVAVPANAGNLREAAKLRSYLQAAFAAGIAARQSAQAMPAMRELRITANPARDIVTIKGASNTRERNLSVRELRAYWKRIAKLSGAAGALLRFHLLTGAQRVEQLARLTMDDFDTDAKSVRLRDGKGRRLVKRVHDVPLIPDAMEAMEAMQGGALGPYLFSVTAGEDGADYAATRYRLQPVVEAMTEAGELEKGPFTLGDLRRTVETRLAALGESGEIRAQLQSHGLGGVQSRHYVRHDYADEKRAALVRLHELLTGKPATVTPIKRKRA